MNLRGVPRERIVHGSCAAVDRGRRRTLRGALRSAVALGALACATPQPKAAAPKSNMVSVVTESRYTDIQRGPGAEYCAQMDRVAELIHQQRLSDAEALVDAMLAQFDAHVRDKGGVALSVANQREFEQIRAASSQPAQLVPLDWCYRNVLHEKAFILSEKQDYSGALEVLELEARAAPTSAAPFVERGFVLNRLGRFAEARDAYQRGLEIAASHPSSAPDVAPALRGYGFALIELGELDAAEDAFNRSLALEPGNPIALHELEYIQHLRAK